MTSWTWPYRSASSAIASSASIRSSLVSPIPIRIPVVKGMASSPASAIVSSRAGRDLVRRAEMRASPLREPVRSGLEHQPHRDRDLAEHPQVLAGHHSRIEMWEQPGLLEHEPGAAGQVLDRRVAAEGRQLVPRRLVSQLRLVAEREQSLAAARRGSGASHLQHFLLGHVRPLAAPRRPREGAVVADIPAELRQRDEDLRRIGDDRGATKCARLGAELFGRRREEFLRLHGRRLLGRA